MKAFVYQSTEDPTKLLILPTKDDFTTVPPDIRPDLDLWVFLRAIDLEADQERISLDPEATIRDLEDRGYHLEDVAIRLNLITSDRVAAA